MVADRVDHIAVMSYDSFAFHPALYRLWMREQVRGITKSLAEADAELLMGLSVSRERTSTHRPRAENSRAAWLASVLACPISQGTAIQCLAWPYMPNGKQKQVIGRLGEIGYRHHRAKQSMA